ncbi:MAG: hypothetical protein AUK63_1311 [bacterium P3]|nr:MAG: hypothetical protein AUK63_1311 [bacterium P3]KWW40419.1 MAG: hypothetical protein F083_1656 [bacterium F083]
MHPTPVSDIIVAFHRLLLCAPCVLLAGCNGIYDGLYDDFGGTDIPQYGFVESRADGSGTIYIDATGYDRWVLLDFHRKTMDTVNITAAEPDPEHWDIAIHRYDVRTRDGAAAETPVADLSAAAAMDRDRLAFTADVDSQVVVDMSTMMDGYLGYSPAHVNPVLSRWLDVNTSTMPPVYTLSRKVYIVQMEDGTLAALFFSDYVNEKAAKGYITIQYRYPL